mmetsp:Transcript_9023/g.31779  ORF Transcript_9023/g.31779 Transcript_9023/m.31779 type:complete len:282 (-) Transcript_9023:312-1157(-)
MGRLTGASTRTKRRRSPAGRRLRKTRRARISSARSRPLGHPPPPRRRSRRRLWLSNRRRSAGTSRSTRTETGRPTTAFDSESGARRRRSALYFIRGRQRRRSRTWSTARAASSRRTARTGVRRAERVDPREHGNDEGGLASRRRPHQGPAAQAAARAAREVCNHRGVGRTFHQRAKGRRRPRRDRRLHGGAHVAGRCAARADAADAQPRSWDAGGSRHAARAALRLAAVPSKRCDADVRGAAADVSSERCGAWRAPAGHHFAAAGGHGRPGGRPGQVPAHR